MKTNHLERAIRLGVFALLVMTSLGLQAQCPSITIREKYEHLGNARPLLWRLNGWDTVVNCNVERITLHADTFITTQHFNGTYLVEEIPYNPPEPFTFGTRMPIGTDDDFGPSVNISFPFCFFGYQKTQITIGANGLGTFASGASNAGCPWSYSAPIPWNNQSIGNVPGSLEIMRDAIYGVYEDTYPPAAPSPRGIYYGSSPESDYPCRHICFSWNHVPQFNHSGSDSTTHNCSYQIVIYEGTNIIEVHVRDRMAADSWNGKNGIIGIQNATGETQVSHYHQTGWGTDPSFYIRPNSPAAFFPEGFNTFQTNIHNRAWRFTPQGETVKNIRWYRLIEDANGNVIDSVEVGNQVGDTNGYYIDVNQRTSISVAPNRTTRYMVTCRYQSATGYWYGRDGNSMHDTITIGVDREDSLKLVNGLDNQTGPITICEGRTASVSLTYPNTQTIDSATWSAVKVLYGNRIVMPASAIQDNFVNCVLRSQENQLEPNHIDSVWIYCTAKFKNGCTNHDSILVRTFPNFSIHDTAGICNGDSYTWCGETYTTQGTYQKHYYSEPGCDSNRYLHLIVSDISHTTDYVLDCKPHTWINGKTYSADNDDTRWMDTVLLKNQWGCDSTVTLDFTFIPMEAIIHHNPEVATLDELTIECTDASYGHDSRLWLLPNGETTTSSVTYINFPLKGIDSMTVRLAVHNNYGCDDTATVVVPLHKVSRYVPNVFTPDRTENNRFQPMLQGNISDLQCWIYNRHGELVYYFTGPDGYWDGTASNGTKCQQGTYVYVLRYRTSLEPNTTLEIPGTITLIR